MRQRGRKSSAELSVVPVRCDLQRPPPPTNLTKAQAKIWREIVDTSPAGWFREGDTLLSLFCQHTATAELINSMIDKTDFKTTPLPQLNRLLGIRCRETMLILSLATKMRLTPQARMHPRTAGRAFDSAQPGPRPWDR